MGCMGTGKGYCLETSQKAHKTKGNQAGGSKTARGKTGFLEIFQDKIDWFCRGGGEDGYFKFYLWGLAGCDVMVIY